MGPNATPQKVCQPPVHLPQHNVTTTRNTTHPQQSGSNWAQAQMRDAAAANKHEERGHTLSPFFLLPLCPPIPSHPSFPSLPFLSPFIPPPLLSLFFFLSFFSKYLIHV